MLRVEAAVMVRTTAATRVLERVVCRARLAWSATAEIGQPALVCAGPALRVHQGASVAVRHLANSCAEAAGSTR